jgi:hypothetical protein
LELPLGVRDGIGQGDWDVVTPGVLASASRFRKKRLSMLVDTVSTCFGTDDCSVSGSAGNSVCCIVDEKYLGISSANSGRITGRQAHIIPTLNSIADTVAYSGISYDISLLLATSPSVRRLIMDTGNELEDDRLVFTAEPRIYVTARPDEDRGTGYMFVHTYIVFPGAEHTWVWPTILPVPNTSDNRETSMTVTGNVVYTVEIGATPGSAQRPEHQKPALPNSELQRHNQLLQIDESEQGDETRQSDQFVLSEFT